MLKKMKPQMHTDKHRFYLDFISVYLCLSVVSFSYEIILSIYLWQTKSLLRLLQTLILDV
jgi:hypothetical protein